MERDNLMERAPLPSPLPARASQGEGAEDFSDGGCFQEGLSVGRPLQCPCRDEQRAVGWL